MSVNALHTMGVLSPFLLPFTSFSISPSLPPPPVSHSLPLIQLEVWVLWGSATNSPAGPSLATKRIFGASRGAIKRFMGHISCIF